MTAVLDSPPERNHAATRYAALVAVNVKQYRLRHAWSQSYLAYVAHLDEAALAPIEAGGAFDTDLAAFDTLDILATALGVPFYALFMSQREAASWRMPAAVRVPPR